jgi:hypothetical protein
MVAEWRNGVRNVGIGSCRSGISDHCGTVSEYTGESLREYEYNQKEAVSDHTAEK